MMEKEVIIGLDIGGTKIKAGIIDKQGCVCGTPITVPTNPYAPGSVILDQIFALLRSVQREVEGTKVIGLGVGCTGPLDCRKGIILDVANLPTLNYFPLKETLEQEFSWKVLMENDANAMILGEAVWGAGRNENPILGITLGTGLGCALVINQQIWQGNAGCAGEIWTSPYKDGIIEDYVSGNAITRIYKESTNKELAACDIANLARQGNVQAMQAWNTFAQALAYSLAWVVNTIDPKVVIIGGSIIKSADLYWDKVDLLFRQFICRPTADAIRIRPASLGDNAGFIGAATLFINQ